MAQGDGEEVVAASALAAIEGFIGAVQHLHDSIITASGGIPGGDAARLSSAMARPFQMWGGAPLFPTALERAAVAFHGIVCGHTFTDGNKRTGTLLALVLLQHLGHMDREATPAEVEAVGQIALAAAQPGGMPVEAIAIEFEVIFGERR